MQLPLTKNAAVLTSMNSDLILETTEQVSSFSCFKPDQEYEKLLEQVRPFGKDLALETLRRDESGPAAIDLFQDLSVFDEPVASASVGSQACNEGAGCVSRGEIVVQFSSI